MENTRLLEAQNVIKIYGVGTRQQFEALHGIDFSMDSGDFVCVMGPSGSGKSTFVNNMSTIDLPTKGKVYIAGQSVRTMGENELGKFRYQNLGFIFQEFNLLNSLTIYENIAVPLTLNSLPQEDIRERVEQIARTLGIDSLLDKFPNECSGGQRQRTAVARSLVTNPKIIVADEPTGNLDSRNSHELLTLFKELNDTQGVSILMVTHDSQIASYSTKVIYLKDGNIEATLERGNLSQKDYFYKIVDLNSSESQKFFD